MKLHYFAFSFVGNADTASVFIGYEDENVTIPRISEAKKCAKMPDTSVLLAVSYLGLMDKDDFIGGQK